VLVAIEGLDGCGKTTVARTLANMIGAEYTTLPPAPMRLAATTVLEDYDSLARYLYYLSCVSAVAEAPRLAPHVVADRFIASAHALHVHVKGKVAGALRHLDFGHADLTIYLHVAEEERRLRLLDRGRPLDPFEERLNEDGDFRNQVVRQLRSWPGTVELDTTGRGPDEVATLARDLWRAASLRAHS
jgi:thymidylate kinase